MSNGVINSLALLLEHSELTRRKVVIFPLMVLFGFFTFAGALVGQDTWGGIGVFIGGFLGFMTPIVVIVALLGAIAAKDNFDEWRSARK